VGPGVEVEEVLAALWWTVLLLEVVDDPGDGEVFAIIAAIGTGRSGSRGVTSGELWDRRACPVLSRC